MRRVRLGKKGRLDKKCGPRLNARSRLLLHEFRGARSFASRWSIAVLLADEAMHARSK